MAVESGDRDSGGDPGEAAPSEAEGATDDSHMGEGKSEVQGGAVHACIADRDKDGVAPISETHAEGITRTKRRRVAGIRRLLGLVRGFPSTVFYTTRYPGIFYTVSGTFTKLAWPMPVDFALI